MTEITFVKLWDEPEPQREVLCRAFHADVYLGSFPKVDETESPETWLPLMRPDPPEGQPRVWIILACRPAQDGMARTVLGGIVFELYRETGDWLATYLAVRPAERDRGLGSDLFANMLRTIGANATRPDWRLFAETEDPLRRQSTKRAPMYERLVKLSHLGLWRLPFGYVQPALGPGKHLLDDLMLVCWAPDSEHDPAGIPASRIIAFLREFYKALGQSDAGALRGMIDELSRSPSIVPERL